MRGCEKRSPQIFRPFAVRELGVDANNWDRIEALFFSGLDLPPSARAPWLDALAATDPDAAREVSEMLDAHLHGTPLRLEAAFGTGAGEVDPAPADRLPVGTQVGPYQIEGLLGVGGMAEVYRAVRVDGLYRQTIALKVLRPGYHAAEFARMFQAERQILARLEHANIAAILGGGSTDAGLPYLAMQLVDGVPITRHCVDGAVPLRERLRLFGRVCEAVQFAHARLIVHRDLKPSNILVTAAGEPMLLDFGIAKLLAPDPDDAFYAPTRTGIRLLTPEHAAPEQLMAGPITTATDVYALGLLLFELLTDRRAFAPLAGGSHEIGRAMIEEGPGPPSSVVDDRGMAARLSGDLDRIVGKALRADPSHRYASAGQFADDVERYLAGLPVRAQPDSVRYRARKFARRHRGMLSAAAAVGLLLVGSTVASLVQARRVAAERDTAERERAQSTAVVGLLTSLFEASNPRLVPGADTLRISDFLDQAEARVSQLDDQPTLQAQMWHVLGKMYAARGAFRQAVPLLERSHVRQVALAGVEDGASARIEHDLAMATYQFEGSDRSVTRVRATSERLGQLLGEGHADALIALQDLAIATDDATERTRLLDRLVALRSGAHADDSVATASLLNAQASDHMQRSRYREALALFQHAGAILDRTLGPEHPNRLTLAGNAAAALTQLAQYDRAEALGREVLEARERVLGAESMEVAIARENLATVLANQGRFAEAETLLRAALATFEGSFAPGHWRTRNTLRNLGLVVALRGAPEAGLFLLDSAVAGTAEGDPSHAFTRGQRAIPLLRLGRLDEAAEVAAAAAEIVDRSTPEGHVYRADIAVSIGIIALARDRPEEAQRAFQAASAVLEPMWAATHPKRSQAACGLAVSRAWGSGAWGAGSGGDGAAGATPDPPDPCTAYARWGLASPLLLGWAGIDDAGLIPGR